MAAESSGVGNFGNSLRSNSRHVSLELKKIICKVFGVLSPLDEELVSVMQMRCQDEDCPDHDETLIIIFNQHDEDSKIKLKLKKPMNEVTEVDVKGIYAEHQAAQLDGPSAPCECCEHNIEKQRNGCGCCGFKLQESTTDVIQRSNTISFTVTALVGGHVWNLELDASTTIRGVKSQIHVQLGGPSDACQRFLFRGRQLENDGSLLDFGIENGSNIVLVRDQVGK